MKTTALIFDLDGTVLDNEKAWGNSFRKVLKDLGVETSDEYPHVSGIGVQENWPIFIKKFNIETELSHEELEQKTREEYKNQAKSVELQDGFENFINSAREMGYLTALATSNIWMAVEEVFDKFDIESFFDVVTTAEEVTEKKPNPSIFLITAQKFGVDPSECVVFEDSPSGVEAAISAGMQVVGVARNDQIKNKLKQTNDVLIIDDFTDVSIDELPESD